MQRIHASILLVSLIDLCEGAGMDESAVIRSDRCHCTTRKTNYDLGGRPYRKAGNGHWKIVGKHNIRDESGVLVATKNALEYFAHNPPENPIAGCLRNSYNCLEEGCCKTRWIMDEYVLKDADEEVRDRYVYTVNSFVLHSFVFSVSNARVHLYGFFSNK